MLGAHCTSRHSLSAVLPSTPAMRWVGRHCTLHVSMGIARQWICSWMLVLEGTLSSRFSLCNDPFSSVRSAYTAACGHSHSVHVLLASGADATLLDRHGYAAADLAASGKVASMAMQYSNQPIYLWFLLPQKHAWYRIGDFRVGHAICHCARKWMTFGGKLLT